MAPITLTQQDRVYLARIVATEADHSLARKDPDLYRRQVAGIVDTVLNRVASPQFPDTVAGVANQRSQFSAINGPTGRNYTVYGSVEKVPDSIVTALTRNVVNDWVNERIAGAPSIVGGGLHYANPHYSDRSNRAWIDALDGPRFGQGNSIHHHGTTAGFTPVEAQLAGDFYNGDGVRLPPGEIPNVVASRLDTQPRRVEPTMPTPRDQRPAREIGLPTPASERPAPVQVDTSRRLLPVIGPTGNVLQDDIGGSFSHAEVLALRQPPKTAAPRPVSRQAISYAGQESTRGQAAPPERTETRPTGFGTASRPPASPAHAQLAMAPQSYAGQERGPSGAAPSAPTPVRNAAQPDRGAVTRNEQRLAPQIPAPAASPADIPKYITRTEKVPVAASAETPKGKEAIPLGIVINKGSRDSVAQQAAGLETAKKFEQEFKTRTIKELNPEWIAANQPKVETQVAPVEKVGQEHSYGILGDIRQAVGIPAEGFGSAIVTGIRDAFKGGMTSQGAAPQVRNGHVGGGSHAIAVNNRGSSPVTLVSQGKKSASSVPGMNMDIYRANREVLGGRGFNQADINKALASGKTLLKPS